MPQRTPTSDLIDTSTFQRSAMVRLVSSFINHEFSLDNYHLQLYSYCPFGPPFNQACYFFRRGNQERSQPDARQFRTRGHDGVPITVGVFKGTHLQWLSVGGDLGAVR
jgi:hypothetical protein